MLLKLILLAQSTRTALDDETSCWLKNCSLSWLAAISLCRSRAVEDDKPLLGFGIVADKFLGNSGKILGKAPCFNLCRCNV